MASRFPVRSGAPVNGGARAAATAHLLNGSDARGAGTAVATSEVTAPLACYHLPASAFTEIEPLAAAELTGWRYLVIGSNKSVADFAIEDGVDEKGAEALPVVFEDPVSVDAILEAGLAGEAAFAEQGQESLEVRLLATFAGPERWLWFHDRMVPYGNGDLIVSLGRDAKRLIGAEEFLESLAQRAEDQIASTSAESIKPDSEAGGGFR